MLVTYVGITCVLLTGQTVIVGILYESPDTIHDPVKKELKKKIQSDYAGLNGTDVMTVAWNVVMQKVKCCGVDSYDDFTGATNWVYDYTSTSVSTVLKTPLACCKQLPTSDDFTCASTSGASDDNNNLYTGCYDKTWDKILGNKAVVTGAVAGVLLIQLCLVIFAVVIMCTRGNGKKNKVGPAEKKGKPLKDSVQAIEKSPEGLNF